MDKKRIAAAFAGAREAGRAAFIVYITAGDPSLATTAKLIPALAGAGADIIELGVPFSDPLADGPVIQAASQRALAGGTTLDGILGMVGRVRPQVDVPLVLMTYCNPLLRRGYADFAERAAGAGVDGVIVPDLPLEECGPLQRELDRGGIDLVQLIAPTTPAARQAELCRVSRGFAYYVTVAGITGTRDALPAGLADNLDRLRAVSPVPVAAGFGISTAEQAEVVGRHADGVIVGSALVRRIAAAADETEVVARAAAFVRELRGTAGRVGAL
ncbi:MAG: tryptophan synthase subunit alpha [Deltaproteobacteria bacterium]|nr:tryptophan synthase subunit alpha [Candidatus Anaeroferrophillacea bacterium]